MQRIQSRLFVIPIVIMGLMALARIKAFAQDPWKDLEKRPSTLGLEKGIASYHTADITLKLVKASQTVAAMQPNTDTAFDFTTGERLKQRSSNRMYQLGDIDLRVKTEDDADWRNFSTATQRAEVTPITDNDASVLAAADLSATLPANIPLDIRRYWRVDNGKLVMLFKLKNISAKSVEIGSVGFPMIFNNILQGKSLDETHVQNVFYDPYIGMDAGYLQVTRLNGHGPALLVVPYGKTPFEAYNPLLDDPTPRGMDFEGFYEWMTCSKAYAEHEWKDALPWNTPTSVTLQPGETKEFGFKFILAESIPGIEAALIANQRPVAVGVPGYVLPQDTKAKLFLNYPHAVKSMNVEPEGALDIKALPSANKQLKIYAVQGVKWGRARLIINYDDGLCQTINYKVINPETQVVKKLGNFLFTRQWYENKSDPFGRDQSIITYDYEKKQQVTQDSRVWISGLSDEGGSGSWLAGVMKEYLQPDKTEVDKLQRFVNHTLWGNIQYSGGVNKYGVKKSVFYYEPTKMPAGTYSPALNWKSWTSWNHESANDPGRSFNYPHVAAAHWVMYRLARYHTGLVTEKNWDWYLNNAYETIMAMMKLAPYYTQFGQMEGDVFYQILIDLKAEGWNQKAALLEAQMKKRAEHWSSLKYPFGSEMPWDSTGQEEVYLWLSYFGYTAQAESTIDAILGYMPTVPHWGYNGSARRYWDFLYGGKLSRIERQLHHYGSGINAIPVLSEYRKKPNDLYLLRVGYGGLMGAISNITEDGFGSAAFHSFPSTLKIDALSGDYGPNFFGYAINCGTYITNDPKLGWLAFGGNLTNNGKAVNVTITDGGRSRIYIAPLGLWLTLDAGKFNSVKIDAGKNVVIITLDPENANTPAAYLHIGQPVNTQNGHVYHLVNSSKIVRGAHYISLKNTPTVLTIK